MTFGTELKHSDVFCRMCIMVGGLKTSSLSNQLIKITGLIRFRVAKDQDQDFTIVNSEGRDWAVYG